MPNTPIKNEFNAITITKSGSLAATSHFGTFYHDGLIYENRTLIDSHNIIITELSDVKNKLAGDAIVTKIKNVGISILAADCAPILLYDPSQKIIGCIHSGWKGALNGIIKNTINILENIQINYKIWPKTRASEGGNPPTSIKFRKHHGTEITS